MKTHRRVAVSDELDFDNAMANATAAILASGADRIYSVLMAAGYRFGDLMATRHGPAAYRIWMNISDLVDDVRGPLSEEEALSVATQAAREWQTLDTRSQEQVDAYFARWSDSV